MTKSCSYGVNRSIKYIGVSKGSGYTAMENLLVKEGLLCQVMQHASVIPAPGRLAQKDLDFQVILGYTVSFRLAWVTRVDPILKQITHTIKSHSPQYNNNNKLVT